MGSPRIHKEVIDGFLAVTRARRTCYEVQVYDGESETDELIGYWEMPKALYMSDATQIAVNQSKHESKRGEKQRPQLKDGQRRLDAVAREGAETFPPALLEITHETARQMLAAKETEGDTA